MLLMARGNEHNLRITSEMTLKISNLKPIVELLERKGGKIATSLDSREVLRILRINRIPLLMIESNERYILHSHFLKRELPREKAKYKVARNEYKTVRREFLNEGIENILFKSTGLAPSFPYTSDNLDVLIKPSYQEKTRKILQKLGYVELRNVEEPQKFLFRRFREGESVSAIHLHTQIGWGVPFLDNDLIWNGNYRISEDDPIVTIPTPMVGLLVTLAHTFYEDKEVNLLNLLRVHQSLGENVNWEDALSQVRERGWLDGFLFSLLLYSHLEEKLLGESRAPDSMIKYASEKLSGFSALYFRKIQDRDSLQMPLKISFVFSKMLYYKKIIRDRNTRLTHKFYDIIATLLWGAELKLKVHSQPPMLISISGVDGSGKTLQSRLLLKAFRQCDVRTKYVWSRCGCSSFGRIVLGSGKALSRFLRFDKSMKSLSLQNDRTTLGHQQLENRFIRFFWTLAIILEMTLTYNLKVRIPLLFGKVVICDRYLLDALVEIGFSTREKSGHDGFCSTLLRLVTPSPNMSFLIDVSPRVVLERKSEEFSEADLNRQTLLYRELGKRFDVILVDAERPSVEVSEDIVSKALAKYYSDFSTLVKAIFLSNPAQLNR